MSYKNTKKEKKLQELRTKNPLALENEWLRNKVRELEEVIEGMQLFTKSTDIKQTGSEKHIHYTPEARWKLIRAGVKYKDFAIVKVIDNKIVDIIPDIDIK
jgi:hypothetical protein